MIDLRGKRALVTGGSRGIGAATAVLLAECGARVMIGYRSRAEDARAVVERCERPRTPAFACAADLSTEDGVASLFEATETSLGGLDLFVGNAGIWPPADVPLVDMTDDQWRRTMLENVDAMFRTTRAALRMMSDGGRVVLVGSTAGQRGESGHADYAASKGAMISFVKSLCVEVGWRGITVNCVAPGWVDTEMTADAMRDGGRGRIAAGIPVRRVATPGDIAGPIVFLCSSHARHITGEILNVNGGSVLCG